MVFLAITIYEVYKGQKNSMTTEKITKISLAK